MNWDSTDYIIAVGGATFIIGALYLGLRRSNGTAYTSGFLCALATLCVMALAFLAVGIIGDGSNVANLSYPALLSCVLVWTVLARLAPGGMALTMAGAAAAQLAITGLVLVIAVPDMAEIFMNLVFLAGFSFSALMFRFAAKAPDGKSATVTTRRARAHTPLR